MSSFLTTQGRAQTVSLIISGTNGPVWLGFGTASGTTTPSDVALFQETQTRVRGTIAQVTTTTSGDTYQLTSTLTAATAFTLTNLGLFSSSGAPVQGFLTSAVTSSTQNALRVNNIGSWPSSYPYQIQVSTEVMSVVSGLTASGILYANRGANGSTPLSSIAATTAVTQASGVLFAKSDFGGLPLSIGDTIQFTIGIQYQ